MIGWNSFGRPRRSWEENIKWDGAMWTGLVSGCCLVASFCELDGKYFGPTKYKNS